MVKQSAYVPQRGDLVWLAFDPQAGREQAGRRPALVLSPLEYNQKVGLMLACPVTTRAKDYPFETVLPDGLAVTGVVLADHVKSLDWQARQAGFAAKAPAETTAEVLSKLKTLL